MIESPCKKNSCSGNVNRKALPMDINNDKKKYMTADEAHSTYEIGKVKKEQKVNEFANISEQEFEDAVIDYTKRCLERYIPHAAEFGSDHETIVPAHYKTADDDFERINRAKAIIESMVTPYGYTVSWFCGKDIIAINW